MRKIEQKICNAIVENTHMSAQNTICVSNADNTIIELFLHGYKIFQFDRVNKTFKWNDYDWTTKTTASRLNAAFEAMKRLGIGNYRYTYKIKGNGKVYDYNAKERVERELNF